MKRNFFLVLLLFVANDLFPFWPRGKYASWIFNFQVDKTWKFDNNIQTWDVGGELNAGTSTVAFPGTIAWSFESWNDRYHSDDNYNMYWFELYLRNGDNNNDVLQIAHIKIRAGNFEYLPRQIIDYNNNTTYFTQARWYDYEYGSWLCYMVTEYSETTRRFIERVGGNLQVKVITYWDDGSWGTCSNASYVDAADRTFMTNVYPDKPSINNVAWTVNDGKTAIKYTHTVPTGCTFSISESYNNNSFSIPCSNSGTTVTEYIYPFDQSKYPTAAEMSGSVLKYNCYSSKYYQMDYSYYLTSGWNGKNDNGTTVWINSRPSSKTRSSDNTIFEAPQFAQAQNLTCVNQGNGEVKLSWTMKKCTGSLVDKSDIIIECATDANFTQNVSKTHVTYDSQLTNYSKIIAFDDRDKGNKDYYFRVYRANAAPDNTVLTQKCSVRVNTNYAKITSFSGVINAQYRPVLKWNIDGGVCTDNMQLRLKYNGITQNIDLSQAKTTGEYVINDNLPTCDSIVYSIQVVEGSKVHGEEHHLTMMIPETMGSVIASYSVSKGFYNDRVQLAWQIDKDKHNFKHFQIGRKELNTNGKEVFLSVVDCKSGVFDYTYEDLNCVPGVYYQYTITGYTECGGIVNVVAQVTSIGFAQPYGSVSGQITFNGNQGVPNVAINVIGEDNRRSRSLRFLAKDKATLTFPKTLWEKMVGEEGTIEFYKSENGPFKHFAYTYNQNTYTVYEDGQQVSQTAITARPFADGFTFESFDGFIDEIRVWNICRSQEEILRTKNIYLNGTETGLTGYYRCDDEIESELFDISRTGTVFNEHHLEMRGIVPDQDNIPTTEQLALKTYTDKDGNYLINNVPFSVGGTLYKVIPTLGVHEFSPSSRPLYFSSDAATHNSIDFTDKSSFEVSGKVTYENTDYPVKGCQFYVDGQICALEGKPIESDAEGNFTIQVPIGEHAITVKKDGHTFVNGGRYPADPSAIGSKTLFDAPRNNLQFYDNTTVLVVGRVAGGDDEAAKSHGFNLGKATIGQARVVLTPPEDTYNLNLSTTNERTFVCPDTIVCGSVATTGIAEGNKAHSVTILTDAKTGEFAVALPPIDFEVKEIKVINNPAIVYDLGKYENLTLGTGNIHKTGTDTLYTDSVNYKTITYLQKLDAIHYEQPELTIAQWNMPAGALGEKTHYISLPSGQTDTIPLFAIEDGKVNYTLGTPCYLQNNAYSWKISAFETYINFDNNKPDTTLQPMRQAVVTIENELGDKEVALETGNIVNEKGDTVYVVAGQILSLAQNQVLLDSMGTADYIFVVSQPNVVSPYTYNVNINYSTPDRSRLYSWDENGKCKGLVFGARTSGTNFVTEGPDQLLFVLRDPPGAQSTATWSKGERITSTFVKTKDLERGLSNTEIFYFGLDIETVSGVGFAIIEKSKAKNTTGITTEASGTTSWSTSETFEITSSTTLSTKAGSPFVGTPGDIFVGAGTNTLYGNARQVTLERVSDNPKKYNVVVKDAIATGAVFKTTFYYTAMDIENDVIPNYIKMRNSLLQTVEPSAYNNNYPNLTGDIIYITTLSKNDPRFGSDNYDKDVWGSAATPIDSLGGPSYIMIPPQSIPDTVTGYSDKICHYNNQIRRWQHILANNEESKVRVHHSDTKFDRDAFNANPKEYSGGWLMENVSLGGGAVISSSRAQTTSHGKGSVEKDGFKAILKSESGLHVNGFGFTLQGEGYLGSNVTKDESYTEVHTSTIDYTLSANSYEYMSIDVYAAPDGFGPIFSTRGGQTYCPYEGEERTKYFEPGQHELHTATIKMEDPQISADQTTITDVPIGGKAIYTLTLANIADVSPEAFAWLKLYAAPDHNPKGAQLSVDGAPLTEEGRVIKFYPSQPITKTLVLTQADLGVLDYDSIAVVLSSDCSYKYADTVWLSAHFVPTCSDIHVAIENITVNTTTGDTLPVTINGYDRNFRNFKSIRLQYRRMGDNDWHLIREFCTNPADTVGGQKTLITGPAIYYSVKMNDTQFPDGQYEFRAVTACAFGSEEIPNESEIVVVTKDMQRPAALGLPSPINGIYTLDNQIYVDLNEPIQTGRVRDKNISVKGVLNGHNVDDHAVAVQIGATCAMSEADFNFNNNDFTIEFWYNYTTEGQMFSHAQGTDIGLLAGVDNGQLIVYIGGKAITSQALIPQDKWCFFSFEYKAAASAGDSAQITVHYAMESQEVVLFDHVNVPAYDRRGNIWFGGMMGDCKMHDFAIWYKHRAWSVSLSERNNRKDSYTDGLLSYWPMNEGEGFVAHDAVRDRHITLPAATWWYNNNNIALAIPAGEVVKMSLAECPIPAKEDFVFECWFRMQEDGTLFALSDSLLAVGFEDKNVQFNVNGKTLLVPALVDVKDGAWHHFALNYRHNTLPVLLIDGKILDVTGISDMPAFAAAYINFSTEQSTSEVDLDEIRLWKAYLTPQNIALNRRNELKGDEAGLVAYYPMEKDTVDEAMQPIKVFSLQDRVSKHSLNSKFSTLNSSTTSPALTKQRPVEEVKHTYTTSAQRLVINITEPAARIEGCTLEFEVTDLVDERGNYSTPIHWTTYVNRNQLLWGEEALRIAKTALSDTTITLTIVNNSGKVENWSITNAPQWLDFSETGGILQPLQKKQLRATIHGSLAIGNYEQTIYLVGNELVSEPLRLTVRVNAEKPNWTIRPADYEYSMNIIATATINNRLADDSEDVLAAFIDGKLAGVASPKLFSTYSRHYIMMDIYTNLTQAQKDSMNYGLNIHKPVTFKYWDASTGRIFTNVKVSLSGLPQTSDTLNFMGGQLIGTLDKPIRLNAENIVEQDISIEKGWNWISFNVLPENTSISSVLRDILSQITIIKSQEQYAQINALRDTLLGSLKVVECVKGYKLHVNTPYHKTVVGSVINPLYVGIPLKGGNSWSWIGYLPQMSLDVNTALASINPTIGDVIKAQTGFAMWDGFQWTGPLQFLSPGNAYLYSNTGTTDITLYYPSLARNAAPINAQLLNKTATLNSKHSTLNSQFTPVNPGKYPGNMTVTAIVMDGDQVVTDAEVGIFAGDECRASAFAEDGLWFITIPGDKTELLTIKVATPQSTIDYSRTLTYVEDAMIGTIAEPYVIQIGEGTGLDEVESGKSKAESQTSKFIKSGLLYIQRNSKIYNAQGQEL